MQNLSSGYTETHTYRCANKREKPLCLNTGKMEDEHSGKIVGD